MATPPAKSSHENANGHARALPVWEPGERRQAGSCGIGVQLVKCPNNDILVLSVREGSSAEQAGVGEGDRVVGVDGADISEQGLDCRQVASLIAGPEGSEVRLRVVSAQGREGEVAVARRRAPPVSHEELTRAEEAAQKFLRCQREAAAAGGLAEARGNADDDSYREQRSGVMHLSATGSMISRGVGMEEAAQNGGKEDPASDPDVLVYSDFGQKTREDAAFREGGQHHPRAPIVEAQQGAGEDAVLPADLPRMIHELKELMRQAKEKARTPQLRPIPSTCITRHYPTHHLYLPPAHLFRSTIT